MDDTVQRVHALLNRGQFSDTSAWLPAYSVLQPSKHWRREVGELLEPVNTTPQGDRPLPAPREAGPWAPAFGGAGLGRLGEWRPPGPSRFRFRFFLFFFCISLCSYAGLSNRVTERSSAVRGCRAALSHRVQTVWCLSSCCTLLFSFFLHIHLIADLRFLDALLFIIRPFSSWFCLFFPT